MFAWVPVASLCTYTPIAEKIMSGQVHWVAWGVLAFFFALVTVMGFARFAESGGPVAAARMGPRTPLGTWITWFLLGGDVYTAYTVVRSALVLRLAHTASLLP